MPKEDTRFICLLVISIDSIFRTGKNCYPQVFLEEQKHVITDDVKISSDSDEDNSDEEIPKNIQTKKNSDEEDSSEDNSDEKRYEKR